MPRVKVAPHPRPLSIEGRGESELVGAAQVFADEFCLLVLLPSPLEAEGLGVRGLSANAPQLVILNPRQQIIPGRLTQSEIGCFASYFASETS
jgi:hypothetical protein